MSKVRKKVDCAECNRHRIHRARGLCGGCYDRHQRAGTLDRFSTTAEWLPPDDRAYRKWLTDLRRDFVPNEIVLPFVEAALAKHDGNQVVMCEAAGVTDRRVYDIRRRFRDAEYGTAAKIAMEAGMLAEFEAMTMREVGREDWSDLGSFCGDGAPPKHSGCGSWFHAHYGGGLCEECYSREVLGCGPTEPRDVRLAVAR